MAIIDVIKYAGGNNVLVRWPSDTHPAQSSFGKLSRNDTVDLYSLSSHRLKQWGQLGEILGGVRFPEGGASHWSV